MPIDELIEKLAEIEINFGDCEVQVWTKDADGEECRISKLNIVPGDHNIIQVNID